MVLDVLPALMFLNSETSWLDVAQAVALCENMSSLPLKPQKLVPSVVPFVKELLLPFLLLFWLLQVSADDPQLLVLHFREADNQSFCRLFFVYPEVASFTD